MTVDAGWPAKDLDVAHDMGVSHIRRVKAEGRLEARNCRRGRGSLAPIYNYMEKNCRAWSGMPVPLTPESDIFAHLGSSVGRCGRGLPYQCSFCTILK